MRIIVMIMNIITVFLFLKISSILEKCDHSVIDDKKNMLRFEKNDSIHF